MEGTTVAGITGLITGLTNTASQMQSAIGEVIPIALPVAGTLLVVTIGWRLFRNFTRG